MATAKKTAPKKVAKKTTKAAGTPGTSAPSVSKKKHVAVVMERKCGSLFNRHSHYHVNVLEIEADGKVEDVLKAAEKANELAQKMLGIKLKVLTVETIEIASRETAALKGAEIRAALEKLIKE